MVKKIWLSQPHMEGHEINYVIDAFEKNHIFPLGEYVTRLENQLKSQISDSHNFLAVNSGTSALHLALKLLKLQKDDEVICSTFTFSATVNPIIYEQATPIFVDSEMETWNMCPELLVECIEDRIRKKKKPKAIIVVHLYGMSAKIEELMKIAKDYDIPLIEDAAEALGSSFNKKPLGTFGDFGFYSFNGNKIITGSSGGALITSKQSYYQEGLKYATQSREPVIHYEHKQLGYNYRMSNVLAAIATGQLEILNKRVEQRRKNFAFYFDSLKHYEFVNFQKEGPESYSNRWLSTIYFHKPNLNLSLLNFLADRNIESRPLWKPMHQQPFFKDHPKYLNNCSDYLFDRGLCLPSSSSLNTEELNYIKENIDQWIIKTL